MGGVIGVLHIARLEVIRDNLLHHHGSIARGNGVTLTHIACSKQRVGGIRHADDRGVHVWSITGDRSTCMEHYW